MRVIVQGLCKQGNYARFDFLGQDFTEVGKMIRFTCLDNNWRIDSRNVFKYNDHITL